MHAVEFQATIKDRTIEIPEQYVGRLGKHVRVILLMEEELPRDERESSTDLIDQLIANPLQIPEFMPLSREAAHARD